MEPTTIDFPSRHRPRIILRFLDRDRDRLEKLKLPELRAEAQERDVKVNGTTKAAHIEALSTVVVELDPNLDVEDMGEALVVEEARRRGKQMLAYMDLTDEAAVAETKAAVEAGIRIGRDYIGFLAERTKPGQPVPALTGDDIDAILTELSGSESFEAEALAPLIDRLAELQAAAADAGVEEGEPEVPLAPRKRSRGSSSSSRSRSSTAAKDGDRSGGKASPGGSSRRSSSTTPAVPA